VTERHGKPLAFSCKVMKSVMVNKIVLNKAVIAISVRPSSHH